jgi:UBX domain-containing protein 6
LNDETPVASSSNKKKSNDVYVPIKRNDLTLEAQHARDAAIARMTKQNNKPMDFSLKAIKEQARRELEEHAKKVEVQSSMKQLNITEEKKEQYTIDGVYFYCPFISDEILPKKEWKGRIKTFLYEQMPSDPGLTACLIIKNCNTLDKAEDCIETIKKYLNNIIANTEEEKFHKIRMSNRIFSEKVANVEGSLEFMRAAGFREQICDGENFLVWSRDFSLDLLIQLYEALGKHFYDY